MKPKKPVLAAIMNVIIPGLGCAYVGNWFYAVIFFIWVPLAYIASFIVSGFITMLLPEGVTKNTLTIVIILLLIVRIVYEQASMPYQMAVEFNQGLKIANE